eukprot:TRINITY_DN7306_c0_g1_i1.p1 TRINITY_DN7306_c0_g1~~TRINITY_DN7306_c0_g1_i1.p1  ORF type:complete len:333 (+),score=37.45 TRINITY_DN7306_c0_g1_i1:44-1042(+)
MSSSKEAWKTFHAKVCNDFTEEELAGVSLPILHGLLKHYGVSSAVEAARIEIYWRVLNKEGPEKKTTLEMSHAVLRTPPPAPTPAPRLRMRSSSPAVTSVCGVAEHPAPFEVPKPKRSPSLQRRKLMRYELPATGNPNTLCSAVRERSPSPFRTLTPRKIGSCNPNDLAPEEKVISRRSMSTGAPRRTSITEVNASPVRTRRVCRIPPSPSTPCQKKITKSFLSSPADPNVSQSDSDVFMREIVGHGDWTGPRGAYSHSLQGKRSASAAASPSTPPSTRCTGKSSRYTPQDSGAPPFGVVGCAPETKITKIPRSLTQTSPAKGAGMRFIATY